MKNQINHEKNCHRHNIINPISCMSLKVCGHDHESPSKLRKAHSMQETEGNFIALVFDQCFQSRLVTGNYNWMFFTLTRIECGKDFVRWWIIVDRFPQNRTWAYLEVIRWLWWIMRLNKRTNLFCRFSILTVMILFYLVFILIWWFLRLC